jgi:hypothetical protein
LLYAFVAVLWSVPFHCDLANARERVGGCTVKDAMFGPFAVTLEKVAAIDVVTIEQAFETHTGDRNAVAPLAIGFDRMIAALSGIKEHDLPVRVGHRSLNRGDIAGVVERCVEAQQPIVFGIGFDADNSAGCACGMNGERANVAANIYDTIAGLDLVSWRVVLAVGNDVANEHFVAGLAANAEPKAIAADGFFTPSQPDSQGIPAGLQAIRQAAFADGFPGTYGQRLALRSGSLVRRWGHASTVIALKG